MRVPFLDLRAQAHELGTALHEAVGRVLDSQQCVLGPELERFEAAMAAYTGVRHAIGVGSGTDALALAMAALGVRPGQLVVTTAFSFFATASTIVRLGARPLFVDIDPATMNLDAAAAAAVLASALGDVAGILPVHLYGRLAPWTRSAPSPRHGLGGRGCGSGPSAPGRPPAGAQPGRCLSFYPTKNLTRGTAAWCSPTTRGSGACGETAARARSLYCTRRSGSFPSTRCKRGVAAKLPRLDVERRRRSRRYAARWRRGGSGAPDGPSCRRLGRRRTSSISTCPGAGAGSAGRAPGEPGIGTQVYPVPLHRQPALARALVPAPLRWTEQAAGEIALPICAVERGQVDLVVDEMAAFYRRGRATRRALR
jgi:hypothetical protein